MIHRIRNPINKTMIIVNTDNYINDIDINYNDEII